MKLFWTTIAGVALLLGAAGCATAPSSNPASKSSIAAYTPAPTPTPMPPVVTPTPAPTVVAVPVPVTKPAPVAKPKPKPLPAPPVVPAPTPVAAPVTPTPTPTPTVDPLTEWLAHPTFTCAPGTVPGWLNEQGIPTSCVGDDPCPVDDVPNGCAVSTPAPDVKN